MFNIKKDTKTEGLTPEEVLVSRREHGDNILRRQKGESFWKRFFSNLGDPVIKILIVALILNVILTLGHTNWVESVGICASILLATLISTVSEYGSDAAFGKLSEQCNRQLCRVRRGGEIVSIPIGEVVVGDVLIVTAGEMIAADGYLISGELGVNQSAMTGESVEVIKRADGQRELSLHSKNALFRGCLVLSGEGEMVACAVGERTFIGGIGKELQERTRESPLKLRLSKLARQISKLGYASAALVAFAYLFNAFVIDGGFVLEETLSRIRDVPYLLSHLMSALTLALSVVVMAVPEGLPMMIAVVLSSNVKQMTRDGVLVRKGAGIEAAGSMNLLFTDKTGTLTEGKLSVTKIICADTSEKSTAELLAKDGKIRELCELCAVLNTSAKMSAHSKRALGGNSTDRAMLEAFGRKSNLVGRVGWKIPFDSDSKISAVRLEGRDSMTLIKGAPEKLLPFVRGGYVGDKISSFDKAAFESAIRQKMREGKRIILVAVSDSRSEQDVRCGEYGSLTVVCAAVLSDKLRRDARAAVSDLRGAGVQVVMITGDSIDTAIAVSRDVGIMHKDKLALESSRLADMSDEEIARILPRLCVVARALPSDKSRLVKIAENMGLVVGMTGDGINDAPALRRADVGFSMGDGTQVAKDAGDIVILDNSLSSIVKAVLYGRNIFKSIRKFICLQLMMNFCAVGISMIGPFIGVDAPVTVVQMLWINIVMDTLGGLAFAKEAPSARCMREKPKRRDEPILNVYMMNQIVMQGAFTVGLYIAFLRLPSIRSFFRMSGGDAYLMSAFFALFIFSSVFNCFNARSDRIRFLSGIRKNFTFIFIMCAVLEIQILFIYLGGDVLRGAPLTPRELCFTMALSLFVFPADLLRKCLWRFVLKKKEGY